MSQKNKLIIPIWMQLSIATTLIIVTTIFSLSYFILKQQKVMLYEQTVKLGTVSVNYFVNNARISLLDDNILQLNTLLKEATAIEGIHYAVIINNENTIKAHTDYKLIGKQLAKFRQMADFTTKGEITYFSYRSSLGEQLLNLTRTIKFQKKTLGKVHVGVSIDFIEHLIYERSRSILGITAVIVVLGILVAMLLGLRFSKPVSELVEATHKIAQGNYNARVNLIRNDELGSLATAFNKMSVELWKKSLMQESFGKYVGPDVLDLIMAEPETVWLKGKKGQATVLFTDIRGFTAYSEDNEPEVVVSNLNQYFEIATNAIIRHGGYIDKFIGDAVLGVFGVPIFHQDHQKRAVCCALEMQQNLKAAGTDNALLTSIGIGLNSGEVVSGNIGSQDKMEYTVIGDTVNVASRLNGLAGSGEIIISKKIREELGHEIKVKALAPQKIKGKSEPIEVFKLSGEINA